jgi:hypothetical protein
MRTTRSGLLLSLLVLASAMGGVAVGLRLRSQASVATDSSGKQAPAGATSSPIAAASAVDERTGRSVPKLTVPPAEVLITDPSDPRYDAAKLVDANIKAPEALFTAEPRNPVWASKMEDRIGATLKNDLDALVPHGAEAQVECRTQTCRVVVTLADPTDARRANFALQIGALGDTVSFQSSRNAKPGQVELFAMQGEQMKDPEAWSQFNREKRKAFLERARSEPPPVMSDLHISADMLPKE